MLELKAGEFVAAASELAGLSSYISGTSSPGAKKVKIFHKDEKLDDSDRQWLKPRLAALPEHLTALGADVTMLCVKDAEDKFVVSWCTWGTVKDYLDDITNTLKRELSLKIVLVLQPQEANYFAPKEPLFGQDFADRFKDRGVFELDEAAKCLALSRPTAAVFHLMRLLEIGIGALASCLSIPDPVKPAERNWAIVLKHIKEDGLDKKWPKASDRMSGDGALFESLYASLDAVKNPWRNDTVHVARKYTDDEAKHIFIAVTGFMKKLSARMDEAGKPLA